MRFRFKTTLISLINYFLVDLRYFYIADLYERIAKLECVLRENNLSDIDLAKDSELSTEIISSSETVDRDVEKDSAEFVRKISVMKSQILDLEKENNVLRATASDDKAKLLSEEQTKDNVSDSLHDLDGQLALAVKGREEIERQLREEREAFMMSEEKLQSEVASLKEEIRKYKQQWQEEREMFMEQERLMQQKLDQLSDGRQGFTEDCEGAEDSSILSLKIEKNNLCNRVTSLASKVASLERSKTRLENENEKLLTEIRKGKDYCSDVEETMKEDIDSVRSCLQEQIDRLKSDLEAKTCELRDSRKGCENMQCHVEELYNELDEVNKILSDERTKSKKLEIESLEFKKKERVYENVIAASMEGDEKNMLSNFVKKRGERWNGDVVELRKKIEDLEKKNRELANAADRKEFSVEAIKQGFESKLRDVSAFTHSITFNFNSWNILPSSCLPESYNLSSLKSKINKLDLISLFLAFRILISSIFGDLHRPPWPFLNKTHSILQLPPSKYKFNKLDLISLSS